MMQDHRICDARIPVPGVQQYIRLAHIVRNITPLPPRLNLKARLLHHKTGINITPSVCRIYRDDVHLSPFLSNDDIRAWQNRPWGVAIFRIVPP